MIHKPILRSRWRVALGRRYFILKRSVRWWMQRQPFATQRTAGSDVFTSCVAAHATPLRRNLSDADVWLQDNKIHNLMLAAQRLNNVIIQPGQTFSYWHQLGRPSKARGFRPGMQLVNGEVRVAVGGGLCQMSNLIYWMTLHTPLVVTERWRHQYDVFPDVNRTQPFGSGATCSYNYVDLQIRNVSLQPFRLNVWLDDTHLHGAWLSTVPSPHVYEVYERNHTLEQGYWGGYVRRNEIWRITRDAQDEQILEDAFIAANTGYMMYSPLLPDGGSRLSTQ